MSSHAIHFFGVFGGTTYFFFYTLLMAKDGTGEVGREALTLFCSLDRIMIHTCGFFTDVFFGWGLIREKN